MTWEHIAFNSTNLDTVLQNRNMSVNKHTQ